MTTPVPLYRNRLLWSDAAFWLGVLMILAAGVTAWSYGVAIFAFLPLPFTLAAVLHQTWWRGAMALAVWGCWFTALWFILT